MKFIRLFLLLGLLPYALTIQGQDTSLKEAVPQLNLDYRILDIEEYNGSAYRIFGEQLRNLPATNISALLAGIIPGYFANHKQGGGLANEKTDFRLRGVRSNAGEVLVLIDGQERDFGILSSHEVESITVLKDAAALALYGMRAANGAILITTREGKQGKPQVELTAQLIARNPLGSIQSLGASDYAKQHNKARINDGLSPLYSQNDIENYLAPEVHNELYPNIDWQDKYLKKRHWSQRYNINILGGNEKSKYFVNAGYIGDNGCFNTDDVQTYSTNHSSQRFNIRSNVDFDISSTTNMSINLYGYNQTNNAPGSGVEDTYKALLKTPPNVFPEWYDDKGYVDQDNQVIVSEEGKIVAGSPMYKNPWAMLNRSGYIKKSELYGSFQTKLSQDLSFVTEGLRASVLLSMDAQTVSSAERKIDYAYYEKDLTDESVLRKTGDDGLMQNGVGEKSSFRRTGFRVQSDYNRTFDKHNVYALAFYEQFENNDDVFLPRRSQSISGWLGYNYDKRYGVDLILSSQGSYKFEAGHRFGLFPTIAAGWTMSNEDFWGELKNTVNYLKLKTSFGQLGNAAGVDEYQYRGRLWNRGNVYPFGTNMSSWVHGYVEDIFANPNLTWEKANIFNLGLDAKLFNNQLSLSAEYFRDSRHDMYVENSNISSLIGNVTPIKQNIGKMYSQGVDIAAMWTSKIGDLGYYIGGTFSYSANEVTEYGEAPQPFDWLHVKGYALNEHRGYVSNGYFNSREDIASSPIQSFSAIQPGDLKYKDINKDGIIDVNDVVPIGYGDVPKAVYGIMFGTDFKGLSLSVLLQGSCMLSKAYPTTVIVPFSENGTMYKHQLDAWTPNNRDAPFPRLSTLDNSDLNNRQQSTFSIDDADYLRLKFVELAYRFWENPQKDQLIKGVKIFVSGYNLLTWTKYQWTDPESTTLTAPVTRNVSLGCSLKF